MEYGIPSLLDEFDVQTLFALTEGNPPDVILNPLDTKDYRITLDYLYGGRKTLTGSFDKNGLPDDFSDFADTIFGFMCFYGTGDLFDPSVYDKALRTQSDLIFCNVQFDEFGKTYCYLTEDGSLEAGDLVVVPVGPDNREAIVRIESVEYHTAEEAPFPIEKTKRIIGRAEDRQNNEDGGARV